MLFRTNENGQVAVILAICILPLIFLLGVMVDFSRQQNLDREVQASLDQAAVAVALFAQANPEASQAQLQTVGQGAFDGNLSSGTTFSLSPVTVVDSDGVVNLSVTGVMPTGLAGVLGVSDLSIAGLTSVQYAGGIGLRPIDIALVLDVSQSMEGEPIEALRGAANDLINLAMPAGSASNVRMGIVPFNHYVNVGLDSVGQPWLTNTGTDSRSIETCSADLAALAAAGCTRQTSVCIDEDCSGRTICPAGVTAPPDVCTTETIDTAFLGCVEERSIPLDVTDTSYTSDPIRGRQLEVSRPCYAENAIQPLTSNAARLMDTVENLRPVWRTYIPSGVIWGQRILSPQAPFDLPSDGLPRDKVLILMSDGANTRSIDSSLRPNGTNIDDANERFEAACDETKDAGIEVFTIAFEVDDMQTEKLLRACASNPGGTFDVSSEAQLSGAFHSIASNFTQIAIVE